MKIVLKFISSLLQTVLFLIFLFIITYRGKAQNYRYTIYNTETSDLPQNQIMSLFQDSHNNIWIGTKFGAAKYNGESFKIYSPHTGAAAGDVQFIFETKKGEILLCAVNGNITKIKGDSLTIYPKIEGFLNYSFYPYKDSLAVAAKLPNEKGNNTLSLFFDGKYKILNRRFGHFARFTYANDTLWAIVRDSLNAYQYKFGFADANNHFKTVKTGRSFHDFQNIGDTLYLVSYKDVYKYFEGKYSKLISGDSISSFRTTTKGIYLQEQAEKNEILEYNFSGAQTASFYIPDFRNIMTDKEGNTWFATENGLYKLAERAFKHYIFKDYGINISNPGVIVDKNNDIWLSSFNGKLYKYIDRKFVDFTKRIPPTYFPFLISRLLKPDGTIIWGGSTNGIIKKEGAKFKHVYPNKFNSVFEIYYDTLTKNTLYGYRNGVLFEDENDKVVFNTATIKKSIVLAIEKDTAGYYWFASRKEIFRYKNKKITKINDTAFTYGALDIVHDAQHNLWFGGEGGLVFYNNRDFEKIDHPKLINKAITALYQIGDSVLLIGTTSGMAAMDLKTFYKHDKKIVIKYYNAHNGFSGYECAQNGFSEDLDGNIWIPVNDRLIKIDPRRLSFENVQVKPYVSSIAVIKNDVWAKHDTTRHTLTYDENRIKFQFSGAYFSNPVTYSYYLEGYEETWREYSNAKEAIYTNLPAGKYTFRVKAANGSEAEKPLTATYSFTIKPAIWETFGFYVFLFLVLSGIIYLIIKKQIKNKTEKQRRFYEQNKLMMQTQMAQLDPHFIFNTLTTTGTFALRLKQIGIYDIIVRFSKLLRVHWNNKDLTRSLQEELDFIDEYCALNRINHGERFDYSINIAPGVDTSIKVLKLSLQNFVENAIKYGIESITGKGQINIGIEQDKLYTTIYIEDNGIGYNKSIKKAARRSRTGINTITQTFNLYNSWNKYKLGFKITDKSDLNPETNGTIVSITLPNNYKYSP